MGDGPTHGWSMIQGDQTTAPNTAVPVDPDTTESSDFGAWAVQGPTCFCRGTMILTAAGEAPVERLRVGDTVTTSAGTEKPIAWIGSGGSVITAQNGHCRPIIVRQNAIADGVPKRDLYLTKARSLYVDGALIPVEHLINGHSVLWDAIAGVVEYYHVELPEHDVLIADGAPAESYKEDGNRDLFRNTTESVVAATDWFAPVLTGAVPLSTRRGATYWPAPAIVPTYRSPAGQRRSTFWWLRQY